MTHKQYGHRNSTDLKIITALQDNPGRWLTSSEIASIIRVGSPHGVGKYLRNMCTDRDDIERYTDQGSHRRYYRYVGIRSDDRGGNSE